jgi:DNA-binding cell septation regulator SpoVG
MENQNSISRTLDQGNIRIGTFSFLDSNKKTKAFCDIRFGRVTAKGFAVIEDNSGKGYFVASPSKLIKDREGNEKNIRITIVDPDFEAELYDRVKALFNQDLAFYKARKP